ncbi:MAG: helix-turn-helix domain-containing protein [Cyclobacteriaceae bacterium]|nr:helix-turn-helix domain-containing protein [Cyclobacteriaceae bacterium]
MKVIPFKVPHLQHEAFRLQEDLLPRFYDKLHQHPETQVMLILKSEGTLVVGDHVGRFKPHDVFLIGSGQPHVFRNDDQYYASSEENAHAISIYFSSQYGGLEFWQLEEMKNIRDFLEPGRNYQATGVDKDQIKALLMKLPAHQGVEKLISFLCILKIFATSNTLTPLGVSSLPKGYSFAEEKRMNDILNFTFRESHRKIFIYEVAEVANLSTEAFCRYFKNRTRKTYSTFLNEVRISNACKLLIEKSAGIEHVCFMVGFNNLSHFNRMFKRITGKTPTTYIQH